MPEFHAEAPQETVSEGLAQGPYVAAIVGVEPMTHRSKRHPFPTNVLINVLEQPV